MAENPPQPHYFHAEAHALKAKLELPIKAEIRPQAYVKLAGTQAELANGEGQRNYFSQHAKNYRLEGIISYAAAHTQVSGHAASEKKHPGGASVTLATSVVEDLNILNVVTADRVVAQISTTHFPGQYSPEVTFLGTHFENLRIARHKAEPLLKFDLLGTRPVGNADEAMYLKMTNDKSVMAAAKRQYGRISKWVAELGERERKKFGVIEPEPSKDDSETKKKYHGFAAPNAADIAAQALAARQEDAKTGRGTSGGVTCSLVEHVDIKDIAVKGPDNVEEKLKLPGTACGHIIHIPDFGTIFLAELTVKHNSFNLTMIRLELGCIADGTGSAVSAAVNGRGGSGGGP